VYYLVLRIYYVVLFIVVEEIIQNRVTVFKDKIKSFPLRLSRWMKVQLPQVLRNATRSMNHTCLTLFQTIQERIADNNTLPDTIQFGRECLQCTYQVVYNTTEQIVYEEQTSFPQWTPALSYLSRFIFAKHILPPSPYLETSHGHRIVVIPLLGPIQPASSHYHTDMNSMLSHSILPPHVRDALETAVNDPKIHAIVLRIDSPGGDYQTSDALWREIRLAAQRKPIVASMGSLCTSGGYYLAMACDQIIAEESTITGSIGVATSKYSIEKLLKKFGINREYLSIGRYAQVCINLFYYMRNK
jgi:hypothetical protein